VSISSTIKKELQVVLQELLVNMRKHSEASTVVLKFAKINDQLRMDYKDNGVGLPEGLIPGKGMQHMEIRMKKLGGSLTYMEGKASGTEVVVTVPL
jgi:signal transduction histidine kinase